MRPRGEVAQIVVGRVQSSTELGIVRPTHDETTTKYSDTAFPETSSRMETEIHDIGEHETAASKQREPLCDLNEPAANRKWRGMFGGSIHIRSVAEGRGGVARDSVLKWRACT